MAGGTSGASGFAQDLRLRLDGVSLEGNLAVPAGAAGMVLFVHGSGSSRHSPRNRPWRRRCEGGLATLLFDLLTAEEEQVDLVTRRLRFDIDLLARRTIGATDWLSRQPQVSGLGFGYFGSSTGAAAALIAAAERPQSVQAVVSRGGRPDLAGAALARVRTPVLLVVGALDTPVIDLNRQALAAMPAETEKRLEIIPGATHLFEEPGTLEQAARLAREWFRQHLASPGHGPGRSSS